MLTNLFRRAPSALKRIEWILRYSRRKSGGLALNVAVLLHAAATVPINSGRLKKFWKNTTILELVLFQFNLIDRYCQARDLKLRISLTDAYLEVASRVFSEAALVDGKSFYEVCNNRQDLYFKQNPNSSGLDKGQVDLLIYLIHLHHDAFQKYPTIADARLPGLIIGTGPDGEDVLHLHIAVIEHFNNVVKPMLPLLARMDAQ